MKRSANPPPLEACARLCLERDGSDGAWACRSFQFAEVDPTAPGSGSVCQLGERSRATHRLEPRPGFDHYERVRP